uniref:7TM_GPCR_Srx domain-containing protein n=1 Tax=Steinernema glaseri TaxID=37863 RepID=A0A1I7YQJ1_9BILA
MILMGIIQCATAPAGYVLAGVVHLLDYDPNGIAAIALKFYPGGFRAESMISFVLALNRFRIICGLRYPEVIHKIIMAFACCFGVTYTTSLFTPLCEYRIIPGHYLMEYNLSIPSCEKIRYIGSYFITVPSFMSLILYIIMIGYLVRMKMKTRFSKGSVEERRILFYALTRFVIEFSFVGTYHYVEFPHYPEYDITINVGLMFCSLLVSPALYLIFYKAEYESEGKRHRVVKNTNLIYCTNKKYRPNLMHLGRLVIEFSFEMTDEVRELSLEYPRRIEGH